MSYIQFYVSKAKPRHWGYSAMVSIVGFQPADGGSIPPSPANRLC